MLAIADTFVLVAEDCPARSGTVPPSRATPSRAGLEHELLAAAPYHYTLEDLIYAVHVRHRAIPPETLAGGAGAIRAALFSKPHPCMRASALPKRYGWGVHHDAEGRIALYAVGSAAYRELATPRAGGPALVRAMRNRRG